MHPAYEAILRDLGSADNKSSATADDLGTTQINTLDLNELGMTTGTDRLRSSGL